jgi:hypothetical protein
MVQLVESDGCLNEAGSDGMVIFDAILECIRRERCQAWERREQDGKQKRWRLAMCIHWG